MRFGFTRMSQVSVGVGLQSGEPSCDFIEAPLLLERMVCIKDTEDLTTELRDAAE
ncbi:hypothetical protein [Actinomadura roseirufa]|uniref:hypothetical protein n=1 Tax=Actinomadura roseirufa TaxID=2094049 RepID=UPI0013F1577C|nr:hypothetical protein [Actinomadura roseirufa]